MKKRAPYKKWTKAETDIIRNWIKDNPNKSMHGNREILYLLTDREPASIYTKYYEQRALMSKPYKVPDTNEPATYPHLKAIGDWCKKYLSTDYRELDELKQKLNAIREILK